MNKRKKNQKRKAVNSENNSASYCPLLTAITTQTILFNSIRWSKKWGVDIYKNKINIQYSLLTYNQQILNFIMSFLIKLKLRHF